MQCLFSLELWHLSKQRWKILIYYPSSTNSFYWFYFLMNFNINNFQKDCEQRNKTYLLQSPFPKHLLDFEFYLLNQIIWNYLLLNSRKKINCARIIKAFWIWSYDTSTKIENVCVKQVRHLALIFCDIDETEAKKFSNHSSSFRKSGFTYLFSLSISDVASDGLLSTFLHQCVGNSGSHCQDFSPFCGLCSSLWFLTQGPQSPCMDISEHRGTRAPFYIW